jgi:hypothetical protein
MAVLLKAQFACYFRANFDPAFHRKSGFPQIIRLSNPAFQKKSGFPHFSRPEKRHIKWYVVNTWFTNILKEN